MSFAHALKWSFLSELATKAIQPVVFIILARLLTPEDFGVMSAALMVIGFSQIFWEAGMGKALVQRQTDIEDAANAAFWINICLGFVIAAVVYLVAGPVARTFFHDERVTAVLQVMTLQIVLGAVSSVHTALLQKDMGFKKLFWVRFTTIGLPGLASIPLAWNGMGYWALVTGTLAGQAAQVAMLWQLSGWRPKWTFPSVVAKEMGHFGAWVGASGLLGWFYTWADSLIVGMYLGSHELGLYRMGNQFASMIFAMLFGPILPVLYSYLSRTYRDPEWLSIAALKIIKSLALIAIPTGFLFFMLSSNIEKGMFGTNWKGVEFTIGIFSLVHGFAWVVGMNGEIYRAAGKPKLETIAMLGTAPVYLAIYIYFIHNGLHDFLLARLGAMFFGLFLQLAIANYFLRIQAKQVVFYCIKIFTISFVSILIVRSFSIFHTQSPLAELAIYFLACGITLSILLYFVEKNGSIKEIIRIVSAKSN